MDYTEFHQLWVPRPEKKISIAALGFYEKRWWWAQTKKNGTCTMIYARGDEVIFKTRHPDVNNGDHQRWKPEQDHMAFFAGRDKWNVYCAELLHSKVANGPKNELYIFDIIVSDGKELTGSTFADRMQLLDDRFSGEDEADQIRIDKRITLAKCFNDDFANRFYNLKPEDEGLVLKNPTAVLKPCYKIDSNSSWQVKARVAHKNYSF